MSDLEKGTLDTPRPQRPGMPPRNVSVATLVDEFGPLSAATLVDENIFFVLPEKDLKHKTDDLKKDAKDTKETVDITDSEDTVVGSDDDSAAFIPPDGGLVAWCQVAAGILLNAVAWGTGYVFGIYQLYYTQTLGMDSGAVSWVGSVQTFLTYFFSTVSGLLSDAGYARHVTFAGTLLVLAGGIGTSFVVPAPLSDASLSQNVPGALFLCQAVITGTGLGLLTAPSLPSINAYFYKKRSMALATATFGTGLGGAALPAVVQFLLPAIGFGWAIRCATFLSVFVCASAALLLRQSPLQHKKIQTTQTSEDKTSWLSLQYYKTRLSAFGAQIVDWSAFRELPFVLFMISSFMLYWGLYFAFYYINTYAEEVIGFSSTKGTMLLIMSTALGLPSRVFAGAIADYLVGPLDTLIVSTALQGTILLTWLAVGSSATGMYLFVVFFGLCNGATQSVWVGAISSLSGHAGNRIGARFGMACVVAAVATLAGAPTASALIGDASLTLATSYHTAMIWAAATTLASAAVMVAVRVRFIGWRLRALS
ncbi:major facilitator superfamily transporter [Ophiostoma piceae UAMH 11346]|uniref:Major facilitator superfamily transporter n=1 Tax=Ophiostoma piceae (strain UAMH 11346) TaxID=1262450 RepID=S3C527_OPHP1|nr:major facilitator superfamily transporter [Ophiostoma piceae UAMH 11346]